MERGQKLVGEFFLEIKEGTVRISLSLVEAVEKNDYFFYITKSGWSALASVPLREEFRVLSSYFFTFVLN